MAVRLFQIHIKQSDMDDLAVQPKSKAIETNRRFWWLFLEMDHHHAMLWNMPLRLQLQEHLFGVPRFEYRKAVDPLLASILNPIMSATDATFPMSATDATFPMSATDATFPMNGLDLVPLFSSNAIQTAYYYHCQLLQILPRITELMNQEKQLLCDPMVIQEMRAAIDKLLSDWYDSLPPWMQLIPTHYGQDANCQMPPPWSIAHTQILYYDARMLLHKQSIADDVVYHGLTGNESAYSKMVAIHSASMIAKITKRFLQFNPEFQLLPHKSWRPLVTAGLVLVSSFQHGCFINPQTNTFETYPEHLTDNLYYIKGLVGLLVQGLDNFGHQWTMAKWDADKLRQSAEHTLVIE